MLTRLIDRATTFIPPRNDTLPTTPQATPSTEFDALSRFTLLAADMIAAIPTNTRSRWKEPPVFFFDKRRQAALEVANPTVSAGEQNASLSQRIAAELNSLCESIDLRRVARATTGLRHAAESLSPVCAAAKELADLLAVPDDELVTVLHPELRLGFRLLIRGVADVGQFQILMLDVLGGVLPGQRVLTRFVAACREVNPATTAGVPMTAESRFQLYDAQALRANGSLPDGFSGSDHWLWPHKPMASVSVAGGERVILLGPPAYRATWEVSRRFPALAADVRLLETLTPSQVANRLGKLA